MPSVRSSLQDDRQEIRPANWFELPDDSGIRRCGSHCGAFTLQHASIYVYNYSVGEHNDVTIRKDTESTHCIASRFRNTTNVFSSFAQDPNAKTEPAASSSKPSGTFVEVTQSLGFYP